MRAHRFFRDAAYGVKYFSSNNCALENELLFHRDVLAYCLLLAKRLQTTFWETRRDLSKGTIKF